MEISIKASLVKIRGNSFMKRREVVELATAFQNTQNSPFLIKNSRTRALKGLGAYPHAEMAMPDSHRYP